MKKMILCLSSMLIYLFSFSQNKTDTSLQLTVFKKTLNFIAFGDWGRNDEYKQKEVADELGIIAKQISASFIISTGDNFYPSGVRSTQDHNWIASFEDIYTAHALQTDWYVVLGNHDYKGNPQAEIDYTKIDRRWNMPDHYFSKKVFLNDDTTKQVLMIFLDTSPFLSQYYLSADHAENIKKQDTSAQRKWLEAQLSDNSPNIKWKLVIGHHPIYTGGKRIAAPETKELNQLLKPIFDKYNVDAYICGHEHSLQYMQPSGSKTNYFISGAGSETTPSLLYTDGGKFALSENGFIGFSITPEAMYVQIINFQGQVLYKDIIKK